MESSDKLTKTMSNMMIAYIMTGGISSNIIIFIWPSLDIAQIVILKVLPLLLIMIAHFKYYTLFGRIKEEWLFFILYSFFVLYYLTAGKIYPAEELLSVPTSVTGYISRLLYLVCALTCYKTLFKNIDVRYLTFFMLILCTLPSILYISWFGIDRLQIYSAANFEDEFIGLLTLGYSNAVLVLISIFFWDKLADNKLLSLVLSVLLLFASGLILIVCTKRGPLFWTLISAFCILYFKNVRFIKFIGAIVCVVLLLYVFGKEIISFISDIAPKSGERIMATIYEGDTANRIGGSDDSVYGVAWSQFLRSPIWGSYFRIISTNMFKGLYPHNIFLEILISMGLIGFVPFWDLLRKVFVRSRKALRSNYTDNQYLIVILFLCSFTHLMTTGTILLNVAFWTLLFAIINIDSFKIIAKESTVR